MTISQRRSSFGIGVVASLVAILAALFTAWFLVSDMCLDSGGRVTSAGFGCEFASGPATFLLVPPPVVVIVALSGIGAGGACFLALRRWHRRAAD